MPIGDRREGSVMHPLVSRSKFFRALAWILPGGALLGVSVVLAVMAFPAAASPTHNRGHQGHKGDGVTVSKAPYGTLDNGTVDDGTAIDQYTLANQRGMTVKIITYGGIVTEIDTPDRHGKIANVALGFDNLADYVAKSPYFGAIIGRYANRIAKGTFTLDGTTYTLPINNGAELAARRHQGLRQVVWDAPRSCRARRQAQLHEPRRRGGLSGHAQSRRHLHAHQQERAEDRLPRDHRQGHDRQSHEPHVLQPRGRGLRRRLRSGAVAQGAQLHAGRHHAHPDRRDRARGAARRSTSPSRPRSGCAFARPTRRS